MFVPLSKRYECAELCNKSTNCLVDVTWQGSSSGTLFSAKRKVSARRGKLNSPSMVGRGRTVGTGHQCPAFIARPSASTPARDLRAIRAYPLVSLPHAAPSMKARGRHRADRG